MAIKTGINAAINGVSTARGWQVTYNAATQKGVASNTKGGPARAAGNTDWKGSYTAYGHTPSVWVGEKFTFLGSEDGAVGVSGAAIVDTISMTIDIEGGTIIGYTVNFSANGALTLNAAAVVADATLPTIYSAVQRKVQIKATSEGAAFADIDDVRTVTLNFSAENKSYVSSSTAGATKREAGNIEATISISIYESSLDAVILPNSIYSVRVFVEAAAYWDISYMMFGEASNINVAREGAEVISYTANGAFTGYARNDAGTMVEGFIKNPAVVTKWPAA